MAAAAEATAAEAARLQAALAGERAARRQMAAPREGGSAGAAAAAAADARAAEAEARAAALQKQVDEHRTESAAARRTLQNELQSAQVSATCCSHGKAKCNCKLAACSVATCIQPVLSARRHAWSSKLLHTPPFYDTCRV